MKRSLLVTCPDCSEEVTLPPHPKKLRDVQCPTCYAVLHVLGDECPACVVDPNHEFVTSGGWWTPHDDSQQAFDEEARLRECLTVR